MNKELEALERIKENCDLFDDGHQWDETFSKLSDKDIAAIETIIKEYEQIKKLFENYNIEFNLVNMRHALFTFAQLKGEYGTNWDNYNKKLKALEIIKKKGIILQFIIETYTVEQYNAGVFGTLVKPLTKEEYELLKETLEK